MKCRKIIAFLIAIIFSAGIISGCGSNEDIISKITDIPEESRTEAQWIKLLKAYDGIYSDEYKEASIKAIEYFPDSEKILELKCANVKLLPAPEISYKNSSSDDGPVTLSFESDEADLEEYGVEGDVFALYVVVDNDISIEDVKNVEETTADQGIYVLPYPFDDKFEVNLATAGEHQVRAFIIYKYENSKISPEYKYSFTIKGSTYSGFDFSNNPGKYTDAVNVTFKGNEGASIYYTTNGSDPYDIQKGEMVNATEFKDKIRIGSGVTIIKARCISNGVISRLLEGKFTVNIPFDSSSTKVGESSLYDFIAYENLGLYAYNKRTNEFINLIDKKVKGISVNVRGTSSIAKENPAKVSGLMLAEAISQYNEEGDCIDIWYCDYADNIKKLTYIDDELAKETIDSLTYLPDVMGGHWVGSEWMSDQPQVGNISVVSKASLMTEKLAAYFDWKDHKLRVCDVNGANERIVLEDSSVIKNFDALSGKYYLFRKEDGSHWILDTDSGEIKPNTLISEDKGVFLGYSSSAAYFYDGSIIRIPIDFTAI